MRNHTRTVLALALILAVPGFALRADARIRDSASQWAGAYHLHWPSSTASYSLVISPGSRFTLTEIGCFGNSEVSHGSVAYRDGVLLLDPSPAAAEGFVSLLRTMVPVRWDGVLYLVDEDRVTNFASAVKSGSEECRIYCSAFFGLESDLAKAEARWYAKKRSLRGY